MKPMQTMSITELCLEAQAHAAKTEDRTMSYLLGYLNGSAMQLLAAAQAQHDALDVLMAERCATQHEFRPTEHPCWPAIVQGNQAIKRAKGEG